MSIKERLLAVSYTHRAEAVRIISARKATKGEREIYEDEADNHNQIILRYWQSSKSDLAEILSNPIVVTNGDERKELFSALQQGVKNLKAKIGTS